MPKSKHSPEFRAKVSQEYLDGIGSIQFLADKYSIGYSTLKGWINEYQIHGIAAFYHPSNRNRTYSKEFKLRCVEAVLNGEGTVDDIIAKYAISSRSVLRSWIKVYNANREFKDYNPKREVMHNLSRRDLPEPPARQSRAVRGAVAFFGAVRQKRKASYIIPWLLMV